MKTILTDNVTVREGELYFGEHSCVALAKKYSTPLYIMDEERIRRNCREYASSIKEEGGPRRRKVRRRGSAAQLQAPSPRFALLWAFCGGGSPVSKGALGRAPWPDAGRLLRTERLRRMLCIAPKLRRSKADFATTRP